MLVYLIHKLTCMQFSRYNHWLISLSLTAYMKYKPMGLSGLEPPNSRLSGCLLYTSHYKMPSGVFDTLCDVAKMDKKEI